MINFRKIIQAIKKAERKILLCLVILVVGAIVAIFAIGNLSKVSLKDAIFYFKGEGKNSKLFYINKGSQPKYLATLPSEEVDLGKYKAPQKNYLSNDGRTLIYFERINEVPIGTVPKNNNFVIYRIIYKPKYLNLATGISKEIEGNLDTTGVLFSPDNREIAWVLTVKESTIEELEAAGRKREVWISNYDGKNSKILATLDEKAILLQRWQDDFIYFWGVRGVGYYSLGRINVKNGKVEYVKPKYCSEDLTNCQNFKFSLSGELIIYEASVLEEGKEVSRLFVESFDGKKSWQILVKSPAGDRLWMPDEESIIYTQQEQRPSAALKEKIHLVNLKTGKDREIYSGSFISQIFPDSNGKYLYFIEKETDKKFNLVRIDIAKKQNKSY